jgi:hypothetical protein
VIKVPDHNGNIDVSIILDIELDHTNSLDIFNQMLLANRENGSGKSLIVE